MDGSRSELGDIGFGYRPRAPYASDPARTRGRFYGEPESPTRTPFQRDRDRIIHSTAFRRLKHKTQVFVADEGDHYRTRSHCRVAQIARALAALRGDGRQAIALVTTSATRRSGIPARTLNAGWRNGAASMVPSRWEVTAGRRYAEFDRLNLTQRP